MGPLGTPLPPQQYVVHLQELAENGSVVADRQRTFTASQPLALVNVTLARGARYNVSVDVTAGTRRSTAVTALISK